MSESTPPIWIEKRLEDIAEITGGSTPSTDEPRFWGGNIPFVTPTDITKLKGDNYLEKTERTITKEGYEAISSRLIKPGTVLMTSRATIGDCAINSIDVVTNQGFANFSSHGDIDNLWLLYLLRSKKSSFRKLASGSTFLEVARGSLRKVRVPVPPLIEQRGIAEVLGTADEAIMRTDAIILKSEELKRGMMQRLLTRGIRHTEFKQTELGEIPKTWEIRTIEEAYSIYDCDHRTPQYLDNGVPIIRPRDVAPFMYDFNSCSKISKEDYIEFTRRYIPKKEDIVYSRNASYGIAGFMISNEKYCIGQDMVILTSNTNSNKYLFYVLNSNRILHEIKKISTGSTFKRINLAEIKKLKILLPPLDEQEKIMNILWNIDVKKITDVTNKMKIEKMKSGLMQILLSGRVRVRLDEGGLHRIRNS